MADDLSFEEFRAIELRSRSKNKPKSENISSKEKSSKKTAPEVDPLNEMMMGRSKASATKPKKAVRKGAGLLSKLGVFLEMHEMQAAVCILLIMDTFSSFYLVTGVFADDTSVMFDIWHRGLKSFSTFSLFFFVIEISANLLAFNFSIIGHFGYLIDVLVVAWQVYLESDGTSKAYKLLNLFRLWRVLRLFFSMLEIERGEHEDTKDILATSIKDLEEAKEKLQLMEDDIEREKEARNAVEEMLQNYKEEVDTLNEALKIAAMDIAEVAEAEDDFFSSDEEDEGDDEIRTATGEKFAEDGSSIGGAAGEERDSKKNREELYRLAMSGNAASGQKKSTVIVHDDGTFEHK